MYEVIVLKDGYSKPVKAGLTEAGGSITLLKGPKNIVVDTGSPWDRELLLNGLLREGLRPEDITFSICTSGQSDKVGNLNLFPLATHIVSSTVSQRLRSNGVEPEMVDYVVCTHGHSDHVGNLNLFQTCTHILSYDICHRDQYHLHDFQRGIPYEIDDYVEIWPTPGHTGADVSVIVKATRHGTVAVTGDLFENQEDLEDPELWQGNSENPDEQEQSRISILRVADHIVPGHGSMFQVPAEYRKQMRVVMIKEEHHYDASGEGFVASSSSSECVIVETD